MQSFLWNKRFACKFRKYNYMIIIKNMFLLSCFPSPSALWDSIELFLQQLSIFVV